MQQLTYVQKTHYALLTACAMCFIGHGSFGIITKEVWCNYFAVFGISHNVAYRLMPLVGFIDISLGISLLVYPTKAVAAWLVVWGIVTASLRPMSGEPFAELVERAGNYGAPLALLLLHGGIPANAGGWFAKLKPTIPLAGTTAQQLERLLRAIVFLLLAGHGWLNIIEKQSLLAQYTSLGFNNADVTAQAAGFFEIAAAVSVLLYPVRSVILVFFIWKTASELFYPRWELFEWIERGGSYGCILALWFVLKAPAVQKSYPAVAH